MYIEFVEKMLIATIPAMRCYESIGIETDLFKLGLTKTQAEELLSQVGEALNIEVPIKTINPVAYQSISSISDLLQNLTVPVPEKIRV